MTDDCLSKYELLVHGWFSEIGNEGVGVNIPVDDGEISGFYASRIIEAPSLDSAVNRVKENIRQELSSSLLKNADTTIINLEIEEHAEVDPSANTTSLSGFTFY